MTVALGDSEPDSIPRERMSIALGFTLLDAARHIEYSCRVPAASTRARARLESGHVCVRIADEAKAEAGAREAHLSSHRCHVAPLDDESHSSGRQ